VQSLDQFASPRRVIVVERWNRRLRVIQPQVEARSLAQRVPTQAKK